MPHFAYTVIDHGVRREGTLDAENIAVAQARLREGGCMVLKLEQTRQAAAAGRGKLERTLARFLIRSSQLELSFVQFAQLIHSGVPILVALQSVGSQAPHYLRRIYADITTSVQSGRSLEQSFRDEAPFLGNATIGLIGIGESNGTLDEMLRYAAELMERARKVRSQILGAMAYPAGVIAFAMGLGYFMVTKVIPQLMSFIGTKDPTTLPKVTQYLIYTNDFLQVYGIYVLLAPVVLVAAFIAARKSSQTAVAVDRAILWVPLTGKALRHYANTMWCRTLGALLKSGIDAMSALDLVSLTMGNAYYAHQFRGMRMQIRQGASLSKASADHGIKKLCPMAYTMIPVSEESGGLDESLLQVADYTEEQLTRRVALISKMVEPMAYVIVGTMVGFIMFGFYLAMMQATGSVV